MEADEIKHQYDHARLQALEVWIFARLLLDNFGEGHKTICFKQVDSVRGLMGLERTGMHRRWAAGRGERGWPPFLAPVPSGQGCHFLNWGLGEAQVAEENQVCNFDVTHLRGLRNIEEKPTEVRVAGG